MSDIAVESSASVLRVELTRPARKNAMTSDMYLQLSQIFGAAAQDETVQAVLWHAAGDDFCAGNDIGDFLSHPPGPGASPQAQLMEAFIAFDKPIVAAVQGAAIGGGTTMLTHCDVVYAGESAHFRTPFVDLALVPEFGSSFALPARLGHLRAVEMLLLSETIPAARAAELGLVTRVVPDSDLFTTAQATAHALAAKPSGALRAAKRLIKQPFLDPLKQAIASELQEFAARVRSADAKEALAAFLEKRPPNFARATEGTAAG